MKELILEVSLHVPDPGPQTSKELLESNLNKIGHKMIAAACTDDVQWTSTQVRVLKGRVEPSVRRKVSNPLTINIVILTVIVSVLGVISILRVAERIEAERDLQRNARLQQSIQDGTANGVERSTE